MSVCVCAYVCMCVFVCVCVGGEADVRCIAAEESVLEESADVDMKRVVVWVWG